MMKAKYDVENKITAKEFAKICKKHSYGWTVGDCEEAIRIITEAMKEVLLERKSFTLKNFATFDTYVGESSGTRIGRNPKKPEQEFVLKKRVRPKIIWSKNFKNDFKI